MSDMHSAHLAQLEGAILCLLRESVDSHDQHDAIAINAARDQQGEVVIDITYTVRGLPVAGEGL